MRGPALFFAHSPNGKVLASAVGLGIKNMMTFFNLLLFAANFAECRAQISGPEFIDGESFPNCGPRRNEWSSSKGKYFYALFIYISYVFSELTPALITLLLLSYTNT